MDSLKICCFTGHRDIPEHLTRGAKDMLEKAVRSLARQGVSSFRAGGARGFDCMAALAVIAIRDNEFPNIKLDLFLPCKDQTRGWSLWEKAQYADIQKKADITAYNFLTFGKPFQPGEKRNLHTVTLHYNPAIPSEIFKLNQLGYGANQKKKFDSVTSTTS